ncbi:MAG: hypothetical protein KAH96_01415 [Alphaproteobacteria bacterium]|nr:hypothetical protein [Alphaproteobacteria bacterium]
MGLVKNVLLAPYRGGVKVGNALKVKPDEDSFGKKVLKRGVLNVAAPVAAVALAYGMVSVVPMLMNMTGTYIDLAMHGVKQTQVWSPMIFNLSPPSLGGLIAYVSAGVVGTGIAVSGLAGLAKNAMKENIKFLKPAIKSVFNVGAGIGKSLEVKPEDSKKTKIAKMSILNVDGDANKSGVRELGEVREQLPPADKISQFFQQGHSTESLLPPTATSSSQESIPLQGKISGNGGLKL